MTPANQAPSAVAKPIADALRLHWSFDRNQLHSHSWHDREDFIEKTLPGLIDTAIAAAVAAERERVAATPPLEGVQCAATILASNEPRPDTGPMQFAGDWPGVFIRGDHALGYIMRLNGDDPWREGAICQLAELLRSCDVGKIRARNNQ